VFVARNNFKMSHFLLLTIFSFTLCSANRLLSVSRRDLRHADDCYTDDECGVTADGVSRTCTEWGECVDIDYSWWRTRYSTKTCSNSAANKITDYLGDVAVANCGDLCGTNRWCWFFSVESGVNCVLYRDCNYDRNVQNKVKTYKMIIDRSPTGAPSASPVSSEDVHWAITEPGQSCTHLCENSLRGECGFRAGEILASQTSSRVEEWAIEAGIECTEIDRRCDMSESPIVNAKLEGDNNPTDGHCTWCGALKNTPDNKRCDRAYQERMRLCPCIQVGRYAYRLRGKAGSEKVILNSSAEFTLSKEWKNFYVNKNKKITIEFTNDKGSDRDVFFASSFPHSIVFPNSWDSWNCDTSKENSRCDNVREGKFKWNGVYEITFS